MPEISIMVPVEEVRAELGSILATPPFVRSPRLGRLLAYLCEKALAGEGAQIKEYTIGVEVLERPPAFNPADDAIARVEVHRLRKRLKEYYEGDGAASRFRIEIPNGQYAPIFVVQAGPDPQTPAPPMAPAPSPSVRVPGLRSRIVGAAWLVLTAVVIFVLVMLVRNGRNARETLRPEMSFPSAKALDAVRLGCGQPQPHVDRLGREWLADRYFDGGAPALEPKQFIARAFDPKLFQFARAGTFNYDVPLAAGVYELRLYFVETVYGPGAPGGAGEHSRVFDVFANGRVILSDFDILSDADGPFTADVRVFKDISPALDGKLHLTFKSKRELARVSAIELVPARPHLLNPIRIYLGDSPYTDSAGRIWMPEDYSLGGQSALHPRPVTASSDPELYATERYGHFSYAIPVDTGAYRVALYFAEKFFGPANPAGAGGPGSRLFDVFANGTALLRDFDIYQEGGMNRAVVKTFHNLKPNSQGKLVLSFVPVHDYASLYALEVLDASK